MEHFDKISHRKLGLRALLVGLMAGQLVQPAAAYWGSYWPFNSDQKWGVFAACTAGAASLAAAYWWYKAKTKQPVVPSLQQRTSSLPSQQEDNYKKQQLEHVKNAYKNVVGYDIRGLDGLSPEVAMAIIRKRLHEHNKQVAANEGWTPRKKTPFVIVDFKAVEPPQRAGSLQEYGYRPARLIKVLENTDKIEEGDRKELQLLQYLLRRGDCKNLCQQVMEQRELLNDIVSMVKGYLEVDAFDVFKKFQFRGALSTELQGARMPFIECSFAQPGLISIKHDCEKGLLGVVDVTGGGWAARVSNRFSSPVFAGWSARNLIVARRSFWEIGDMRPPDESIFVRYTGDGYAAGLIQLLTVSFDGRKVAYSTKSRPLDKYHLIFIRDLMDSSQKKIVIKCDHNPEYIMLSPDGSRVLGCFDIKRKSRYVAIFDTADGQRLCKLNLNLSNVWTIWPFKFSWSPTNNNILASKKYWGNRIHIWNVTTGKCLKEFPSKRDSHVIAWSPEGNEIATVSENGAIELVDLATLARAKIPFGSSSVDDIVWHKDRFTVLHDKADLTVLRFLGYYDILAPDPTTTPQDEVGGG